MGHFIKEATGELTKDDLRALRLVYRNRLAALKMEIICERDAGTKTGVTTS